MSEKRERAAAGTPRRERAARAAHDATFARSHPSDLLFCKRSGTRPRHCLAAPQQAVSPHLAAHHGSHGEPTRSALFGSDGAHMTCST